MTVPMPTPPPPPGTAAAKSSVRRGPSLEIRCVLLWGWEQTPHIRQEPLASLGMWCNLVRAGGCPVSPDQLVGEVRRDFLRSLRGFRCTSCLAVSLCAPKPLR